jgi:hypothetical protein
LVAAAAHSWRGLVDQHERVYSRWIGEPSAASL